MKRLSNTLFLFGMHMAWFGVWFDDVMRFVRQLRMHLWIDE